MPEKLIYLLYRTFLALLTPAILVYALLRIIRNREYAKTLRERLGFLPEEFEQIRSGAIWIHAVSVGEVLMAGTLIRELRKSIAVPVFVSTTTLAGYKTAQERLKGIATGSFYAPADYVHAVRRVLRRMRPSLVIVLETEIWPNLFREVKRSGCGLVIASGRISYKAFGWYRSRRWFFRHVLAWPDRVLVQSEAMRERFLAAGASTEQVAVTGSLKVDFEPKPPDANSPVALWLADGSGPVLIAASTTADERVDEDLVAIQALAELDGWRLILAPRKPERFGSVARLLQSRGIAFWKRSDNAFSSEARLLLLDSIGELPSLFGYADAVFMGGTLTATEGHNFLEPAFAAKPVIVGPRLGNFRDIADDFIAHRALISLNDASGLAEAVRNALASPDVGMRARERADAHRGAAWKTSEHVHRVYAESLFCPRHPFLSRFFLGLLARVWEHGARTRAARELVRRHGMAKLATPVISVGNITVGGTGKTPLVMHLARRLRDRGLEPVVLTRGYGRVAGHDPLIAPRGTSRPVLLTGDEPQIFLRSGVAGVAIGTDRAIAAREAERVLKPSVFLADDAFSHQRLARDIDMVLIDSLDPFGGGELVPLGRLREPLQELRRADIFIVTRCEKGWPTEPIENRLRNWNARAPVFRSRLAPAGWVSARTGEQVEAPKCVVAFCGLGNANAFWRSLTELRMAPVDRLEYDDHHQYSPTELRRMVRHAEAIGASALVTTEKDVVNLPDHFGIMLGRMTLLWLSVQVEIENEEELLRLLMVEK